MEWNEGVGLSFGFGKLDLIQFDFAASGDNPYYMLVKCTQDGETLYDRTEQLNSYLDYISGVEELEYSDSEAVYYNLQGIRIEKPVKGNIYISDGKKIKY